MMTVNINVLLSPWSNCIKVFKRTVPLRISLLNYNVVFFLDHLRKKFKILSIFSSGKSLVSVKSSLNSDARRFAGIEDMELKHPRITIASVLTGSLCRYHRNAVLSITGDAQYLAITGKKKSPFS